MKVVNTEEVNKRQHELASIINDLINTDGTHSTKIPTLCLIRTSNISEPLHTVHEPSLCVIARGSKMVTLAGEIYQYDPASFMITSVHLPMCGQILQASHETPFLGIQLVFTADQILNIMNESNQIWRGKMSSGRGLLVSKTSPQLLDAVIRLLHLLENPEDIPVLSPLIIREIFYRVLQGEQGDLIRQFAMIGSHAQCIAGVIHFIRQKFDQPLRIEELAKEANMSTSTLHSYFKKVTAMSPIQYQKQLRLQEARRLLISEPIDAADAAFRVGYESPSQFSREYTRLFGLPPKSDVNRLHYITL